MSKGYKQMAQQSKHLITCEQEYGRKVDSCLLLVGVKISVSVRENLSVSIKFSSAYACRTSPHLSCRYICTCKKAIHAQSYSLQPCLQQQKTKQSKMED